ncbi:MAG TPA: phospholipase D family protein [Burkholderiaceae bacterium]|nr:phospholipase D family protein [Burkholderiaceae bacterium]
MLARLVRRAAALLALCALLALVGCGTLPSIDRDKIASEAIPLDAKTTLGRIASTSQQEPQLSGFRLMPLGSFSLDTRVQLARRAEVSLDVQYYHFENDETGRWLLRALRDAAVRGVRVRVLIDDLYTGGTDPLWLAFAAHPNVQVRLFNPFCCARGYGQTERFVASANEWSRVNHRMHNKLFIADGAMAVIGGRNVANEYFLRGMGDNFIDVDAFTVGWIVPPLQFQFDRYWNSAAVYPLEAIAKTDLDPATLRARFEDWTGPATTPPPDELPSNDILGYGPVADDLDGGRLGLIWGDAFVFADHPDKPFDSQVGGEPLDTSVTYNLFEVIRQAKKEVVMSSPYFVPGELSLAMLRELRSRGVSVAVMTNSLASTDEPVVHIGYAAHREELLRMGVELYELSGSRLKLNKRPFLFGQSLGRLHAKLAVIDRTALFIGSMNLDPRSASINTELGAVVTNPQLARELLRVIDIDRLQSAYRVRLRGNGHGLEWVSNDGEKETVLTEEPDSTAWLRIKSWLLAPFVPVEQL